SLLADNPKAPRVTESSRRVHHRLRPATGLPTRPSPSWSPTGTPGGTVVRLPRLLPSLGDAAASGLFTLQTILQQAGRAQCIAGTSNPKWGRPDLGPPYGDDPNDQHWIMEGWNDYKSGMYGPVRWPRALGIYPAATSVYSNLLQPPIN